MSALFFERPSCADVKPFVKAPDAADAGLYWAPWSIPRQPEPVRGERFSRSDSANAQHEEEFFIDWS